jgi:O-antigen/teichoic acid export membrane protein
VIQPSGVRRLALNTGWSFFAALIARVANVIILIAISRIAGPGEAGILTIGFSYLAITGRFATWGLDQILIRNVAQDPSQATRYFFNFSLIRAGLATITLVLLALFVTNGPYPQNTSFFILLIALNVWPEGIINLCQSVFIAFERMSYGTYIGIIVGFSKLVLGIGALALGYGLYEVILAIILANSLAALAAIWLVHKHLQGGSYQFSMAFCREQLKVAAPFVLIAGTFILDNQADTVVLSWQMSKENLGLYGAATSFVVGISFLPQAYRDAVFPTLARAFESGGEVLDYLYQHSMKYLLIAAIPIVMGVMLLAEPILTLIYGEHFATAATALRVLSIAAGMQFVMILQNRLLVVANQQRWLSLFLLGGLIINVLINLLIVPSIGIAGAAVARVVSNVLVYSLSYWWMCRSMRPFSMGFVWVRPLIAAIIMASVLRFLDESLFLQIGVGALSYLTALLLLGTFSMKELKTWHHILNLKGV